MNNSSDRSNSHNPQKKEKSLPKKSKQKEGKLPDKKSISLEEGTRLYKELVEKRRLSMNNFVGSPYTYVDKVTQEDVAKLKKSFYKEVYYPYKQGELDMERVLKVGVNANSQDKTYSKSKIVYQLKESIEEVTSGLSKKREVLREIDATQDSFKVSSGVPKEAESENRLNLIGRVMEKDIDEGEEFSISDKKILEEFMGFNEEQLEREHERLLISVYYPHK